MNILNPKTTKKSKTSSSWKREPATKNQIRYIYHLGYKGKCPRTKAQAGAIIRDMLKKASNRHELAI